MQFLAESSVEVSFDEEFAAADGTRLSANIYRPSVVPLPVVVMWTPYDNGRFPRAMGMALSAVGLTRYCKRLAVAAEVVVVCVDVRGRGDSAGEFVPFQHEAADAEAVVRQVREQPWCRGRVAVLGHGYGALSALGAARRAAEAVCCAFVTSPPGAAWEVFPGRDGVRRADLLLWRHRIAGRTPQPVDLTDWEKLARLPWPEQEHALGRDDLDWADWPADAGLRAGLEEGAEPVDIPTMIVTGWWDPACRAAVALAGMSAQAQLIVGPWNARAARDPVRQVGGVDWGPRSVLDPLETQIRWLREHFEDPAEQLAGTGPHRETGTRSARGQIFVTGDNSWRTFPDQSEVRPWSLHLVSSGRAQTTAGDGMLVELQPLGDCSDVFTSVLDDPVPAQPAFAPATRAHSPEVLDLTFLNGRHDMVVYTSSPLHDPLSVVGEPLLELHATSDSPVPAHWIVSLEDVFPGGTASLHLGLGMAVTQPGESNAVLRLGPIGHRFLTGHSLRIRIAATCAPLCRSPEGTPAFDRREVLHAGSAVTLPVVGGRS
ncbi:CocE/NonD family hydrolase [Nocardia vulneris]|uniref:CocE/NonD family hydrolase n=1 Tax=Nocardia vulneris TaxID=1141657 RepID=UPI0030D4A581